MAHFKRTLIPLVLFIPLGLMVSAHPATASSTDDFSMSENTMDTALFSSNFSDDDGMGSLSSARPRWLFSISPGFSQLLVDTFEDFNYSDGMALEGSLFYQIHPFWQIGLEGGYSFNHDEETLLYNFFGYDVQIQDRLEIAHGGPAIRFGHWIRGSSPVPWRPYLQSGAAWYKLIHRERLQIDANQFLFNYQLSESSHDYLGASGGGGIQFEVYPSGVIGAQVIYHQVFSRPQNLKFAVYSLQLSYLF